MIRLFSPTIPLLRRLTALLCLLALLCPLLGSALAFAADLPGEDSLPIWNGGSAESYAGSGTSGNPYLITSGEELALLAQQVRSGETFAGKYFRLTADIQLNETDQFHRWESTPPARRWLPIGGYATVALQSAEDYADQLAEGALFVRTEEGYSAAKGYQSGVIYYRKATFNGIFDGDGHTVSGMFVDSDAPCAGLFGVLLDATVRNLHLQDCYVQGREQVGLLAGSLTSDSALAIQNCTVAGTAVGDHAVGLLIGSGEAADSAKVTVGQCRTNGAVRSSAQAGGLLGNWNSSAILTVTDCQSAGRIQCDQAAGGLIGQLNGTQVQLSDCHNHAAIPGKDQIGGLIGDLSIADGIFTVSNCQNGGTLLGKSAVGGLIGQLTMQGNSTDGLVLEILSSRNVGDLYGTENVGGIVGTALLKDQNCALQITGNKNSAIIRATENAGGIVGHADVQKGALTVGACENYGAVSADLSAGGILGSAISTGTLLLNECSGKAVITAEENAGGLVGHLQTISGTATVERGSINGTVKAESYAGGMVGCLQAMEGEAIAEIRNCISGVHLTSKNSAGGIVGLLSAELGKCRISTSVFVGSIGGGCKAPGGIAAIALAVQEGSATQIVDSYYDQDSAVRAMLPGEGAGEEACLATEALDSADLRDPAKLGGLDFTLWQVAEGDRCPTLRNVPYVTEEYQYSVTQNGAILIAYVGRSDIAAIPEKLGGVSVTTILESAFWNSKVIRVTMPDSITAIGEAAFAGCTYLERVTLSANLVSVGARAFKDCTALSEVRASKPLSTLIVGSENEIFRALPFTHPASLQIVHGFEDGSSAGAGSTIRYYVGDYYQIKPLAVTGYKPDADGLTGICAGNDRISVIYRIGTYQLTIRYLYPDGSEAIAPYQGEFVYGTPYRVDTPKLSGYSPDFAYLEGAMPGEDTLLTVYFTEIFAGSEQSDVPTLYIVLLILSGLIMVSCLVYFIYRYRSATVPEEEPELPRRF